MKNYLIIIILLFSIGFLNNYWSNKYEREKRFAENSYNNYNALLTESSNKNIQLRLTVSQLKTEKDSIYHKLDSARIKLKIKEKELKNLAYISDVITKTDTLKLLDTIFVKQFRLDTIVGDKFVNTRLLLEFPNKITVTPTVYNEKYIICRDRKLYKKPKKVFPFYLFQKKIQVVEVVVEDSNPYLDNKVSKHIHIVE